MNGGGLAKFGAEAFVVTGSIVAGNSANPNDSVDLDTTFNGEFTPF